MISLVLRHLSCPQWMKACFVSISVKIIEKTLIKGAVTLGNFICNVSQVFLLHELKKTCYAML